MVAKRFDGNQADLPITEPPNFPMQKTSRVELDILSQVWWDGVDRGRDEVLTQLASILSPDMYNHVLAVMDSAVQS